MFNSISRHISSKTKWTIGLLLVLLLIVAQVSAAGMYCRSDPIVTLSDGTILQFSIALETSKEDVEFIHYEVHVPVGVSANRIIYTPNWARSKELVTIIPDLAAGDYQILTLAETGTANVPVTINAHQIVRGNRGQGIIRQTASGVSGQIVSIYF